MGGESQPPEDVRQALDRLAGLMLFTERFRENPRETLAEYGLGAIPDELVDTLVDMSPDELRVLSELHLEQGWIETGPGVYIFF